MNKGTVPATGQKNQCHCIFSVRGSVFLLGTGSGHQGHAVAHVDARLGAPGRRLFFGFAATQLPLGTWLDRYGSKRVILYSLSLAMLGCLAFSMASSFTGLLAARVLVGVGISACLRALLTGFCRWFDASTLLRWALFCMASSVMGLAQPLVGMSFRPVRAGHVSL